LFKNDAVVTKLLIAGSQ